ncbi:MAG: ATP-dependent DNA helicase RecG [Herpetosiphonaceae bacterium]|nr:ATP-dependent DNA helicase RecG [Herpetosiphonaceae bacterium]
MDEREQIIQLGRCLAAEAQAGYMNAPAGGMEAFLEGWQEVADSAASHPVVQRVLERLAEYDHLAQPARIEALDRSLLELRALFKTPASSSSAAPKSPKIQRPPQPLTLEAPLGDVAGVGPVLVRSFARLGLRTVGDMLYHFPNRYDDYSSRKTIVELMVGTVETVVGEVVEVKTFTTRNSLGGVNIAIKDETGILQISFFGQQWLAKQLFAGQRIVVSGKVGGYNGRLQMTSPKWEPYREDALTHTGRLVPVHPLTKGLYEKNVRTLIKRIVDAATPMVEDHLPDEVRERAHLLPLARALAQVHFPDDAKQLALARYRLGFDEFLFIQVGVLQRKRLWQGEAGYQLHFEQAIHQQFLSKLPFTLTQAQTSVLEEIFADMGRPVAMGRLVQGDVGSGKTVVAAAALVQVIAHGMQGALMAPTEILAEQHYRGLKQLLAQVEVPRSAKMAAERSDDWKERLDQQQIKRMAEIKRLLGMTEAEDMGGAGIRVALLTGSLRTKERKQVLQAIAQGEVDLVIGTHALIQEAVQYNSLGLVVVDEQHRFGVEQRERLKSKGHNPHLLVMTATPIPRTLALSIYGDLDSSVIGERPPGRQPIKTRWIQKADVQKAYSHLRREIKAGRQAFVICPLVEESEKLELDSAVETQTLLQHEVFPELRIGLVHGRMPQIEKDAVMRAFREREFDILVATAVVEVGIDIPNASTIMILGAERFGLAQLHQFRGRVGRGEHQSFCVVVSDVENEQTQERLQALEASEDGFVLAEKDLELRGPGEFFGRRQSGTPDLKMAQMGDLRLLHVARLEADRILEQDPQLERPEHRLLATKVADFWADAEGAS